VAFGRGNTRRSEALAATVVAASGGVKQSSPAAAPPVRSAGRSPKSGFAVCANDRSSRTHRVPSTNPALSCRQYPSPTREPRSPPSVVAVILYLDIGLGLLGIHKSGVGGVARVIGGLRLAIAAAGLAIVSVFLTAFESSFLGKIVENTLIQRRRAG